MRPSCRTLAAVAALLFVSVVVGCGAASEDGAGDPAHETYAGDLPGGEDDVGGSSEGDVGDLEDAPLVAVDDSVSIAPPEPLAATSLVTTANLNLRKGPGTGYAVLAVIPSGSVVTVVAATAQNGFYNVSYAGTTGWSSGSYLKAAPAGGAPTPSVDPNGEPSRDNAIARARAAVGFSYWWGGGAWLAGGPSSSTKGSCSGSCPSCSHSGTYGADCSGLIAKAWQFGTKALEVNSHPYSTASFVKDVSGKWKTVSRDALARGDALVYNSNGAGHIVLYEKGDGWGSPTVYECRGCSYGCVYNTRSFSSAYHGIRRAGF